MRHCAVVLGFRNPRLSKMAADSALADGLDVLLVENGAIPEQLQEVKDYYKGNRKVSIIACRRNGLAPWGMNRGFRAAVRRGYELITLVCNDTTIDKGYARDVERVMGEYQRIGILLPKTMFGMTDVLYSAGVERGPLGFVRLRGHGERDERQYDTPVLSTYSNLVVATVNAGVFRDVGYLDESFVMYLDDVDIGIRAQRKGWAVFYWPYAVARHHALGSVGQSNSKNIGRVMELTSRNRLLLAHRNGMLDARYVLRDALQSLKEILFAPRYALSVLRGKLWFWGRDYR